MTTAPGYSDLFVMVSGQHGRLRELLDEVSHLSGGQRLDMLDTFRAQLAAHEAMEQGWVHPIVAERLADGEGHPGDVDNRLVEERDAGIVLDRLRDLEDQPALFDVQLQLLHEMLLHHMKDEEDRELPLLSTHRELQERVEMILEIAGHVAQVAEDLRDAARTETFVHLVNAARRRLEEIAEGSLTY